MAKKERQLPEKLIQDFVICDNTVNRYGWRLLVEGIDLSGFLTNPVCLLQHATGCIPVGKWINLRVEDSRLIGTVEFDPNDDDSIKLYWKYKDGFMNACSLNVIPTAESDEAALLLPGQCCSTITKCELLEVSLVTLPGQKNAVKLSYPNGKEYKLNLLTNSKTEMAGEKTVEQLQVELAASHKLNAENVIKLHEHRGVITPDEKEHLMELALTNLGIVTKLLEARTAPTKEVIPSTDSKQELANGLVKLHFERGVITEGEKQIFALSAVSDYEGTKKILEAKTGSAAVLGFVQNTGAVAGGEDRSKWSYLEYFKKDQAALQLMATNEPAKFKQLEMQFLAESEKMGVKTTREE